MYLIERGSGALIVTQESTCNCKRREVVYVFAQFEFLLGERKNYWVGWGFGSAFFFCPWKTARYGIGGRAAVKI